MFGANSVAPAGMVGALAFCAGAGFFCMVALLCGSSANNIAAAIKVSVMIFMNFSSLPVIWLLPNDTWRQMASDLLLSSFRRLRLPPESYLRRRTLESRRQRRGLVLW